MTNLIDKVLKQRKDPYDVLGLVFSNFQQASQKQKMPNLEKLFFLLSASFEIQAKNREKDSILQKDQKRTAGRLSEIDAGGSGQALYRRICQGDGVREQGGLASLDLGEEGQCDSEHADQALSSAR